MSSRFDKAHSEWHKLLMSHCILRALGVVCFAFSCSAVAGFAVGFAFAGEVSSQRKPNVLFIAVDDLRPELGCYGNESVRSPHLDKLARSAMVFRRAYVQQAVCSPSRTSVMTGLRPDSTKVYDLETAFRKTIPDAVTLSQHFIASGWHAEGLGKIYHSKAHLQDPKSWSAPWRKSPGARWVNEETNRRIRAKKRDAKKRGLKGRAFDAAKLGPPVEAEDVPDERYQDGMLTNLAIERMRALREQETPWFLAVGFKKPHLPFHAPKRYWDLYDRASIALPKQRSWPSPAPRYARSNWGELRKYEGMPGEGAMTDAQARELIHGYRACVSFVDAQIGKLLDELERLDLEGDTIVVVWGDHGWKLGEYGAWCKHTNYELDTRTALLVRAPGMKGAGRATDALVELVDLYPTLCDLAAIEAPERLEGTSFAKLLDAPETRWKTAVFSQYPRRPRLDGERTPLMGYAMRTAKWRLVDWRMRGSGESVATELYDLSASAFETENVAERHPDVLAELREQLRAGWRGARPPGT